MATYVHGKNAAVLHGVYDLSPWVTEFNTDQNLDVADTSHFGSNSKTFIAGQNDATATLSGLYDGTNAVGQPGQPLGSNAIFAAAVAAEAAAVNNATPISFSPEGVAVGNNTELGLGKHTTYKVSPVVSDVVQISGDIQMTGGLSNGTWLTGLATAVTGTTNSASRDDAALSTRGGRAHQHILSNTFTGATVGKIQHSVDNSVWVDLVSFTSVPTLTVAAEEILVAAGTTINRYVRAVTTISGTGAAVIPISFARN